jgi:hypothetical protein
MWRGMDTIVRAILKRKHILLLKIARHKKQKHPTVPHISNAKIHLKPRLEMPL